MHSDWTSLPLRGRVRVVGLSVVRIVATVGALTWVYLAAPRPTSGDEVLNGTPRLVLALAFFVVVFVWQIRRIGRSTYPGLRALEAGVVSLVLFLVLFALAYLSYDTVYPGSFSESLNHLTSMYFTVTVFSTVGFGDITPVADVARGLVACQMLLDLVYIGFLIKVLFQVAQKAVANRAQNSSSGSNIDA